ncbi:T9SS type A sorting domain-containing protein [bacterium]|nr:T9SS type A sorting domain-containing protein [bacterium]
MKKSVLLSLFFCFAFVFSFAQTSDWTEMMFDPDANFYEVQAAAEAYFETHPKGKGSGWKPYKRWEYYHSLRVKEDGTLPKAGEVLAEVQSYRDRMPANKRSSTTGNWSELGPFGLPANGTGQPNGMGRIAAITFHPTALNTVYAGSASGGIWESNDNAATWTKISNGLTRLGVSSIVVHPTDTDTIYIGTGDRDGGDAPGYGVWRSVDGGTTWAARNNGMGNRTVYEILMDPTNSDIMVASTNAQIYRTVDGGANWTLSFNGHNCKDLDFKPGDPSVVYATGTRLYRSTDNGQTFVQITNGVPVGTQRIALGVSANQPNWVYLFAGDGVGLEGLYRSTDSGVSFTQRSNGPNILGYDVTGGTGSQAWYDLVVTVDPNDASTLYTGAINVWKSIDAGANWAIQTHWVGSAGIPSVHADDHVLEWSPHTGDLYLGHDGGMHFSADAGTSWTEVSSGLAVAQVYKIGQSATVRNLVINGYQDNGTAFYRDGGWYTEIGGDGMECIIDYTDASVMYGALYYGDIRRSINGGLSFGSVAANGVNGITEAGGWVTPYKLHPTDPNIMLVGYDNVWRSNNIKAGAVTWTAISAFASTSNIVDLAIAASDPNVMYVSKGGVSNFYRSINAMAGTPAWTDLDANLPAGGTPKDIEIDPIDPNHIWIALGNDIYESANGGNTWANYSGTLPNISLNTIVYDTASPLEALYIGMDVGVYYRDNTMADWVAFDSGIPNVEVTELEIFYDAECGDDVLRAGTYGRGLWESDLMDPGTLAPIACFEATSTELCEGATVVFTDNSSYSPTSWDWTITPLTFTYVNGTNQFDQAPQVQFNGTGTYTITLAATNANGSDLKTETNYINVGGPAMLPPIMQDLELGTACGTASNCGTTTCAMPGGWTNEINGTDDNIDWRLDAGGTGSVGTGPSTDVNPGTALGLYAYMEASSCSGQTAILTSPCIDLRAVTNASLVFSQHMYGANMGSLHVDVFSGGAWIQDVYAISGDQGDVWDLITVNLTPYTARVIQLRFRGITGPGFTSDVAIDNIQVDGGVLATNLLAFEGKQIENLGNQLFWEVDNLQEGDEFELVKVLSDGNENTMTTIPSNQSNTYSFVDLYPVPGINVYRMYIHSLQGNATPSEIVEIYTPFQGNWTKMYPNPFQETLTVKTFSETSQPILLIVSDLQGKTLMKKTVSTEIGMNTFELNLEALTSGVYFIQFKGKTHKIIRE